MNIADVIALVGEPLAHVPAPLSPRAAEANAFQQHGLEYQFEVDEATDYLIYRHPLRERAFDILGFSRGRFIGGSRKTFAATAPEELELNVGFWRARTLR